MINKTVKDILQNYAEHELLSYKGNRPMPDRDSIIDIIDDVKNVMFPGYFRSENVAGDFAEYYTGQQIAHIYNNLKKQIAKAFSYRNKENLTPTEITERAESISNHFISELPKVQKVLMTDVQAGFDGDPAAQSMEDIIYSYPGLFAIFVYRIAHVLYCEKVPFIPRMMTEYAHGLTGIDINSGATIGEYFFIDHGTGIVIGETCIIGNNVKLYQGVTLGALSTRSGQQLAGVKRHPTIENNVTIYSGASILGGETVIGEESIIGGNCFVTASVPPRTKVTLKEPELIFKGPKTTTQSNWEI